MKKSIAVLSVAFSAVAWSASVDGDIDDVRVAPLVKSHWDQLYAGGNIGGGDKCYNYHTPGQCYCGCGPTALAQIMRYHAWPRTEVNTNYFVYGFDGLNKKVRMEPSYPCKYQGGKTNLTMIGGVYDWSKMPYDTQTSGTSDAEREMIGRLCHDLGVSMSADYDKTSGTGVSSPVAVHNLPGNFHYADTAAIEFPLTTNMKECTREIFEQAILPNLDAGLPCGVMLSGDEGAHIVVCDGYGYHRNDGKLYVHLNVGYSGQWDGWFAYGDTWRINSHDYTVVRGVIFNISPHFNGPIVSGHVVDAQKRPLVGAVLAVSRDGRAITNVVTNVRGEYNFKTDPGDYDVRVSHGQLARTVYMKLEPAISTAYLQTGEYIKDPVAVRIANRRNEDIVLDTTLAKVETPFSVPADGTTFTGSQLVALNCDTDGADIYYTTDGSYPTREATRYTGPFEITAATTVRAVAIKGDASSSLGTFAFVESTYGDVLGTPTTPWTSGGHATWFKDAEGVGGYYDTSDTKNRLRSGTFDFSQSTNKSSWLEATIDGPAKVSFDYRFYTCYYGAFYVVLDGVTTNVSEYVGSYTSSPDWVNGTTIEVGAGVHRLRFDYHSKYNYSNTGFVHLRNMKIVYPNVLRCDLPTYWDSEWSTMTFTDGERSNIWSQLSPTNARVTVSGASSARTLTVDANVALRSLVLDGVVRLTAASGKKLTVGSVNVSGQAQLLGDALDVSGAVTLTTVSSTLFVAGGIGLVPVSGVSGTKVMSAATSGGTTYSLKIGYASPFSAQVTGSSVRWSDLTFTDRNGNSAKWAALGADATARVSLNVAASTTLTMDASVSVRSLAVTGGGSLTLAQSGVHALTVSETTTVNANLSVNGTAAQLGAVALADGKTLAVASVASVASVSGGGTFESSDSVLPIGKGLAADTWTGTLRLDGTITRTTGVADGKYAYAGPLAGTGTFATSGKVPADGVETYCLTGDTSGFAGTLTVNGHKAVVFGDCDAGETALRGKIVVPTGKSVTIANNRTWTAEHGIEVAGELVVSSGASVVGDVVMSDPAARVVVKSGSQVVPTSGVEHYETTATTNGTDVTYTLKIAKVTHAGPYSVTVEAASLNWSDIIWTDANKAPGRWSDLESAGNDVFTINAANDVTITMSGSETASRIVTTGAGTVTLLYDGGKDVPTGMRTALRDSAWKGTVKLAGSRTFAGTDLGEYGNAGSTVELSGNIGGYLKANGSCASSLKLASNCLFTLTGGTSGSSYTFAGKLTGTGQWYFGQYAPGQILCFTGDATEFRGNVNASYYGMVSFGSYGYNSKSNAMVVVNTELVVGEGTDSTIQGALVVNGKLTIGSGAKVSVNYNTITPVRLCSASAQVLVKTGSGIVPVNGTSRTDFTSKSVEGGTLYCFSSATQDPEPPDDPPDDPPEDPDDPDDPAVPDDPDVPSQPTAATNRVPLTVTLSFAMTSDDNMKVRYEVTTNGVSRTWEDASFAFAESGDGRNLWRGAGNKNIGTVLVKDFNVSGSVWNGYPVPNTNLESGNAGDKYWKIDIPFDLGMSVSVTNVLPKAFITNSGGDSSGSGQPTGNNKQYDVNVSCLSSAKVELSAAAEVRTDKLGAALVNTVVGAYEATLSNGYFRILMDNSSCPGNGAFGGIQGLVFQGEIVTVTGNGGGDDDPGGDEPGGDEPGGEEPVEPPVGPVRPGWYVDVTAGDDANGGRSPTDAFKTINAALGRVASDEVIYVAAGIYYESVATSYTDRRTNLRVESLQGPDVTVIDAQQGASCVFDGSLSGQELTFVGFTLQHGSSYMGGGVYGGIYSNCVVTACTASYGGGACDAILFDSRVHGNTATIEGGGVYHSYYPCELHNTYVWDNWVESGSGRTSDNVGGDVDAIVGGDSVGTEPPSNPPVEPSVDGGVASGTIVKNAAGEYVFTPPEGGATVVAVNDAGTNTIVIPPGVLYVTGVDPAKIRIRAGEHELTSAFNVYGDLESGYAAFELNENGVVTNGSEAISVRPVLAPTGSGELATVPFAVGNDVSVGVMTIPGLKYTLLRGATLEALSDPSAAAEASSVVADGTRTRFKDPVPPANKAFYRIRVEVP